MAQREWWQMSKAGATSRRLSLDEEAVVAVEGAAPLDFADVVIGHHRTRRQARRWIASVQRDYPHCLLAVSRQHRGRWCMVGFPARNILVRGGHLDLAVVEQMGRVIYRLWLLRRSE